MEGHIHFRHFWFKLWLISVPSEKHLIDNGVIFLCDKLTKHTISEIPGKPIMD